jgi:bifunctional DNA-binding transcriptional regulator/antitoxin component of YhaV-PrlF toxin-antitoxin module
MGDEVKAKDSESGVSTERATRKGRTNSSRLSSKHQVTIPVDVLREVGLKVGDEIVFSVEEKKIVITKKPLDLLEWVASLGGLYDGYDFAAERAEAWPD